MQIENDVLSFYDSKPTQSLTLKAGPFGFNKEKGVQQVIKHVWDFNLNFFEIFSKIRQTISTLLVILSFMKFFYNI